MSERVVAIATLKYKPVVTYLWWSNGRVTAKESAFDDKRGVIFFNHVADQNAVWSNEKMFYEPRLEGDADFDERLRPLFNNY